MNNFFENFDSKQSLLITLSILKNFNSLFFKELQIDEKTNFDYIWQYIPKSHWRRLNSNLNGCVNSLKRLPYQKNTNFSVLLKKKQRIGEWQDFITQKHMLHYSKNRAKSWNNLGLSLHRLLDIYYHIYVRLLADPNTAKCSWCYESLDKPWKAVLADSLTNNLPHSYFYYACFLSQESTLDVEKISACFNDVKFIVQKSII